MKRLSWIVTLPIMVTVVLFAVANTAPTTVNLWPLPWILEPPLYLILYLCLFVGFLGGGLAAYLSGAKRRRQARAGQRQAEALAGEVSSLKADLARQVSPSSPPAASRPGLPEAPPR
jgi:uncharacterized integral membrane protein